MKARGAPLLAFALSGLASACTGDAGRDVKATPAPRLGTRLEPAPDSEDAFLEALAPLPGPGVRIVYDVDGPGGLDGSMELMVRPGGLRRENWALAHPGPDGEPVQMQASSVHTPDAAWSGAANEAGVIMPSPLRALARAYLALDEASRAMAAENLRRWHEDLRRARTEHPGDVREVAGIACLQMRVAAQDLCLWEETGLALEYRGTEFSVVAKRVELDAAFADDAFALPPEASRARRLAPSASFGVDPEAGVAALVRGDYGPLASVLTPGLRIPLAEALDGGS